jgi:hypothetical protein
MPPPADIEMDSTAAADSTDSSPGDAALAAGTAVGLRSPGIVVEAFTRGHRLRREPDYQID